MSVITKQNFDTVGIAPSFIPASAGGDKFDNSGVNYLFIKNAGASSINVTVNSFTPCSHGFDHDLVQAVAAGTTAKLGPFPQNRFSDDLGQVGVTYSAVTSITVAVVQV